MRRSPLQTAGRWLGGSVAAAVDQFATRYGHLRTGAGRREGRVESMSHAERVEALGGLVALYADVVAQRFHPPPEPIEPRVTHVRALPGGGRVEDLRWPSAQPTFLPDLQDRYHRHPGNTQAAARLFRHTEPRPVVVLVHGYLGGSHAVEERIWPTEWFYRTGLDVALLVLPFHGVRKADPRRPPPFPSRDPRITNEGFRQAMLDARAFIHWLGAGGHRAVGMMGMSLGGYTTALAATLEPSLAFAVPIIPLSSLADFARDHGRLGAVPEEQRAQHELLDEVHRLVSPLHNPSLVPAERVRVIGAERDGITPIHHAARLAEHFGTPLHTWHGGHLLQLGRADAFRGIGRFLRDLDLLDTPAR